MKKSLKKNLRKTQAAGKRSQTITLRQAQGDGERTHSTLLRVRRTITKEMTIGEVIQKYPRVAFLFIDYGLHCVGCPIALSETVEQAAKAHRIDLKKFLKDLNNSIK